MNSTNMTVRQAIEFGTKAHAKQLDDAGNDYFMAHCWQVYEIVKILYPEDFELQAASLLHDTLEDTDTTYEIWLTHLAKMSRISFWKSHMKEKRMIQGGISLICALYAGSS